MYRIKRCMKKLPFLCLVLVFAASMLFTGCGSVSADDYQAMVKSDVYDNYELFKNDLGRLKNEKQMLTYFQRWAAKHKIYNDRWDDNGLILQESAAKDSKNKKSTLLECTVNASDIASTAKEAAMALTAMLNASTHGEISILFTKAGAAATVPDKYLEVDNLISLTERNTPRLFTGSAAQASTTIHKNLSTTAPDTGTAFKISISGCTGGDSAVREYAHPNPIREIGAVLNNCREDGLVMRIASFQGGQSDAEFVQSASAVVWVANSEATKFENKFENAISKYKDKYMKHESDLTFTIEATSMPSTVFTSEDTYSILSLLYTLHDGRYDPDADTDEEDDKKDEELTAFANIGTISTKGDDLTIGICLRAIDQDTFTKMLKTYKDTAELSDAKWKVNESIPLWNGSDNNALVRDITNMADKNDIKLTADTTFKTTNAAVYADKNSKMQVIALGVDMQDATELTSTLLMYLDGQANT